MLRRAKAVFMEIRKLFLQKLVLLMFENQSNGISDRRDRGSSLTVTISLVCKARKEGRILILVIWTLLVLFIEKKKKKKKKKKG
jgi:hypothetical protein